MKLSKITTIISLSLIFLIGLGVLGYTWSKGVLEEIPYSPPAHKDKQQGEVIILPTVDTTGWSTYRNERYGYEVRYPPAWKLDYENVVYNVGLKPIKNSKPSASVTIGWRGTKVERSYLSEWPKVILGGGLTINELTSEKYHNMVLIHFTKDNDAFEIEWYDGEQRNEEAYKVFLQILSTFKFYK